MKELKEDLIPLLNLDLLLRLDYEGQLVLRLQGMGAVTVGVEEDGEKQKVVLLDKEDFKESNLVMLDEEEHIEMVMELWEEALILQ